MVYNNKTGLKLKIPFHKELTDLFDTSMRAIFIVCVFLYILQYFQCILVDSYLPVSFAKISSRKLFIKMSNVFCCVFLRNWAQSSGGSESTERPVGTAGFPQTFPKGKTRLWQPASWPGPPVPALLHGYGHHHQRWRTFIKPWSCKYDMNNITQESFHRLYPTIMWLM